jgi:hypothetical protein
MITISQDAIFVMLIPPLRFVNEVKLFKSMPARRARRTRLKLVARETHTSSDQATGTVTINTKIGRNLGFREVYSGLANDREGCAPCKGGAFQWVQIPSGNRSSRKQSEQSWR